ncbi:hypothetical protein MHYP_G00192870 [Metynnis hypsauchen]
MRVLMTEGSSPRIHHALLSALISLNALVASLIVQHVSINSQSCVELLCSLEGLSPEQVSFTWTRGSEQLLHQNNPSNMSSTLTLCKPHWRDGDTFTCQASCSSNHTLYSKSITIKYTDEGASFLISLKSASRQDTLL